LPFAGINLPGMERGIDGMRRFISLSLAFLAAHALFIGATMAVAALN
jgi:hypothetical protein